jgi:pimeloyl-ACP methyl ester carboxylesterase
MAIVCAGCAAGTPSSAVSSSSPHVLAPTSDVPAAVPRLSAVPSGAWTGAIDIGNGVALHVRCTAGTGLTVILDADLNGDMSEFGLVQPKLPATIHACAYDRAGEGQSSPPSRTGRTSADIATDLHNLLTAAGLRAPYVLVGNHFGGLFDLRYAGMYPADVAGLVLLDPFLPTAFKRFHADCAGIPSDPNKEGLSLCAMMNEAASASLKPPDVPLVVLSAADNPGWSNDEFAVWLQSHRDLAASVTHGRWASVVSNTVIPREQPDATVQAIEEVVSALHGP